MAVKTRKTMYFRANDLNEPKNTHVKVEVFYNLGGMNYFNYRNERRGYYLSVTPVYREHSNGIVTEGFTAYSGTKMLIHECNRNSQKAFREACEYLDNHKMQAVKAYLPKVYVTSWEPEEVVER